MVAVDGGETGTEDGDSRFCECGILRFATEDRP